MEQKGSDFWVKLTCVHHVEGRMPRVEVTSATFNYWKSSFLAINIDDSLIIGSLFNSMYKKLWDQFCRGWNLVFWPPQVQESYTERSILRNERSECKQGEARYTILERVEVKKLNFTRDYWSHSELYILLKIVLCSIVSTFWKKS